MSASAGPISPAAFAIAIQDLPLSNVHTKAAELRNSIAHLHASNEQLAPFAADGDVDCADALRENDEVIKRMEVRIDLLRQEVERRGYRWADAEVEDHEDQVDGAALNGTDEGGAERAPSERWSAGGTLSDDELRRRLAELNGDRDRDRDRDGDGDGDGDEAEDGHVDGDGVHL
ncbi:MAG: hypothetical protein M1838_001555 [Thelocarpon superellum]|nr:MAG: hypothetical protein M1838_001555 [Thelocarpon superellum]